MLEEVNLIKGYLLEPLSGRDGGGGKVLEGVNLIKGYLLEQLPLQ